MKEEEDEHVVRIGESEWRMWKWIGLRGAGFEIKGIEKLAARESAAQADVLLDAELLCEQLWHQAIVSISNEIADADAEIRPSLIKALRTVKKGKLPSLSLPTPEASQSVNSFAQACQVVDYNWEEYERIFEEGVRKTSQEIREIASNERFREAIVWQNHNALHTGIDPMLSKDLSSNRDSKDRRNEEMIATYWQRYCVKNDTIGYFGPVGWARIVEEGKAIEVKAGKELVKERKTYFETWCI